MGRAKEMFLYAAEDAWQASPEYQAMLEERRREVEVPATRRRARVAPTDSEGFDLNLDVLRPKLLVANEVAERLRCDVSTVYDMVRSGRLTGFSLTGNVDMNKRGRKGLRILASSVDALVAGGVAEHAAALPLPAPPVPVVPPHPQPLPAPSRKARTSSRSGSRVVLAPPP